VGLRRLAARGAETLGHSIMDLDFRRAFREIEMGSGYGLNERSHDGRPVQVLPRFLPRARRGNG
jgi:hypothetical protein